MEYKIHICNKRTFQSVPNVRDFDLACCQLEPEPALLHDAVEYKRWLWERLREEKGVEFAAIGLLARESSRGEIILLCWCSVPCFAEVVVKAIRFYQNKYLSPIFEGLAEVVGP